MQNLEDTGPGSRGQPTPQDSQETTYSHKVPPAEPIAQETTEAWLTHKQYESFPKEGILSSPPCIHLADRELVDRTAELHQELAVVWKLNHMPWGGRRGPLCLRTQPRGKALALPPAPTVSCGTNDFTCPRSGRTCTLGMFGWLVILYVISLVGPNKTHLFRSILSWRVLGNL